MTNLPRLGSVSCTSISSRSSNTMYQAFPDLDPKRHANAAAKDAPGYGDTVTTPGGREAESVLASREGVGPPTSTSRVAEIAASRVQYESRGRSSRSTGPGLNGRRRSRRGLGEFVRDVVGIATALRGVTYVPQGAKLAGSSTAADGRARRRTEPRHDQRVATHPAPARGQARAGRRPGHGEHDEAGDVGGRTPERQPGAAIARGAVA